MSTELSLIAKILTDGDLAKVVDRQINSKYFNGKNKTYFKFILNHQKKYGKPPSGKVFNFKFPGVDLPNDLEEDILFYCDEVREKFKHNTIVNAVEKITDDINALETEEAYKKLKSLVYRVENEIVLSDRKSLTINTSSRMEDYEKRERSGGITGIPTGIDRLDEAVSGLNPGELITLLGYTGIGKATPLDSPVLTPNGFIPMKRVKVGTLVIGEDGKPYPVVAIFPQGEKDIYEITFKDGTTSRCCKEHLWKYKTLKDRMHKKDWRVNSLEDILEKHALKAGRNYNLCIPINKPVEFASKGVLPFHPYVMGVLLGDGGFTTDRITLTNPEVDIIERCNLLLEDWGEFTYHKSTNCQYAFKSYNHRINKLYRSIDSLGLKYKKSGDKFIPEKYLYASIKERKELLKGLFDTDGSVNEKGVFTFSTSSNQLADDIVFLCRSLGYRCGSLSYNRGDKGIDYVVSISTDDIIFSSKKHQERYDNRIVPNKKHDYSILKIESVDYAGREECQCIMVDSEDHTYITDDFIVTHNTWIECIVAVNLAKAGFRVLLVTTEMTPKAMMRRIDSIWNKFSYSLFKQGKLSPREKKKYAKYLERMEGSEYFLEVEQATGGVVSVSALVDKHAPEVLIIDGAYMLEDDKSEDDDWRATVRVWRGLHELAILKNIPVVASTASSSEKASLKSINFARLIANYSDVVIGLEADEQMRRDKELAIVPLKVREGELTGKIVMNLNMNKPDWSTIYTKESKEFATLDEGDVPPAIQKPGKRSGSVDD